MKSGLPAWLGMGKSPLSRKAAWEYISIKGSTVWIMGSGSEHKEGESPFKDKLDAEIASSLALSEEASRLLKERGTAQQDFEQRTEYPGLNAMSARAAYYGLQGRLLPSMEQIRLTMARSGPVGEAALARMNALAEHGWKFGALSVSDPYITRHVESAAQRMKFALALGGYNDAISGKIAHSPLQSLVNTVVGLSDGADKDVATKYIHELAHGKYSDGYARYESTPAARAALRELPAAQQTLHGQLMVQEETRAIAAQVAANSRLQGSFVAPQSRGLSALPLEASLKQGQLGSMVKDVWGYEGVKLLSHEQANAAVRDYVKQNYGEMFKNGKLNPRAEAAIAAEISKLPLERPVAPLASGTTLSAEAALSSSRYFNYLSRGGQAVGSLAMLAAVSDVNNQFKMSTGSGVARLLSVGSDWAGFEAGAAVGGYFGEGATRFLVKINPKLAMIALPLFSMGTGLMSSQIMHTTISKPLVQKTKNSIDELLN